MKFDIGYCSCLNYVLFYYRFVNLLGLQFRSQLASTNSRISLWIWKIILLFSSLKSLLIKGVDLVKIDSNIQFCIFQFSNVTLFQYHTGETHYTVRTPGIPLLFRNSGTTAKHTTGTIALVLIIIVRSVFLVLGIFFLSELHVFESLPFLRCRFD